MKIRRLLLPVLFLLLSSVCFGESKNDRGFDFMTVLTEQDQEMDVWYKTPPDSIPHISTVSDVTKGQRFRIALFFSGYQLDKADKAHVSFDIKVRKPDDSVYFEQKNLNGTERKIDQRNILLLSETIVGISFDPPDPWGKYTIDIAGYDAVAGKSKTQSIGITLSPWQLGNKPGTNEEFDKWIKDYHAAPKPNEAVYAFITHCPLTSKKGELAAASLTIFKVIFQENPYLIDHLIAQMKTATEEQNMKIIVMLHLLGKLDKAGIPAGLAEFKAKAATIKLPDPYGETLSGDQQDMLWAEFLATGRIKPIRKLVTNLEYARYTGSLEGYKKSKQTDEDKLKAYKESLFLSATWSIKSNCQQHELVAKYCAYLYEHGDLSTEEKKWLGYVLSKVFEKDKGKDASTKEKRSDKL